MDAKTNAIAILEGIKKAGIDLITSLPDINCLDLINALERDVAIEHVPLCREEEGVGICAGARLVGKKPAIIMQNAGLLNSCNAIVTTAIQLELSILLIVYYAGDTPIVPGTSRALYSISSPETNRRRTERWPAAFRALSQALPTTVKAKDRLCSCYR